MCFSYYGAKGSLVNYYPKPKHNRIIEPFAGSARYSCKYWDREIILADRSKDICRVWNYLKNASEKDILGLPKLKVGESIDEYKYKSLTTDERRFLGFLVNIAFTGGAKTVTKWVGSIEEDLVNISKQVHHFNNWTIINKPYWDLKENWEGTWFIDPPYQFGGDKYPHGSKDISFSRLAKWSTERSGQVIVCENTKATWMEFKPLVNNSGQVHKTVEAMWSNEAWNSMSEQLTFF